MGNKMRTDYEMTDMSELVVWKTTRGKDMKITPWWWSLVWAGCVWVGTAIVSDQGWKTPVGFGMMIGVTWGALAMRWSIRRSNAESKPQTEE